MLLPPWMFGIVAVNDSGFDDLVFGAALDQSAARWLRLGLGLG